MIIALYIHIQSFSYNIYICFSIICITSYEVTINYLSRSYNDIYLLNISFCYNFQYLFLRNYIILQFLIFDIFDTDKYIISFKYNIYFIVLYIIRFLLTIFGIHSIFFFFASHSYLYNVVLSYSRSLN